MSNDVPAGAAMARDLIPAAVDLVASFEGFVDHWYPDPGKGWDVPTCCYGHTDAAGPPYYRDTKARKFTMADGKAILARDLEKVRANVETMVKVPLTDHQFGALVSLTYNIGEGAFARSTLLKRLNAGDYAAAGEQFARWNRSGGKVLNGLTRRRAAEAAFFATNPAPPPQPADDGQDRPPPPTSLASLILSGLVWVIKAIAALFRRKEH